MLDAKTKNQGHKHKCSQKKVFKNFFQAVCKKSLHKILQAISKKKRRRKNISADLQKFKHSKNSAVLELRTGQGLQNVSSRPRMSSRPPPLLIACFIQRDIVQNQFY